MVAYKILENYPAYRVGDDGSIWSRRKRIMLPSGRGSKTVIGKTWHPKKISKQKGKTEGRSYLYVRLSHDKKSRIFRVHRLVLEAFVGPCPEGMECRHLDGDPSNNRLENLRWGTPAENTEDKRKHGRHTSKARYYTHEGKTLILKDWARLKNVKYLTLWNRIKSGMSFADALSIGRYNRKAIAKAKQHASP